MRLKLHFDFERGDGEFNSLVDFTVCHTPTGADSFAMDFKQSFAHAIQQDAPTAKKYEDHTHVHLFSARTGKEKGWGDGHAIDKKDSKVVPQVCSSSSDPDNHVPEPTGTDNNSSTWGGQIRSNLVKTCRKYGLCYAQYAFYGPDGES